MKFNPNYKPRSPIEPVQPSKKILQEKYISSHSAGTYPIPADATKVRVEHDSYDDGYVTLTFLTTEIIENPHYDYQLKRYHKALEKYKRQLATYEDRITEWNKQKKLYDIEQKQKSLEKSKSELKRLCKKLKVGIPEELTKDL